MTPEERKKLISVETKVDKVINLLGGDDELHTVGFIKKIEEKVDKVDKSLEEFLVREKIYKAKATTFGIIGGAIGAFFLLIAKAAISKFI